MSMNDANSKASPRDSSSSWDDEDDGISLSELAGAILGQWKIILAGSILAGAAGNLGAMSESISDQIGVDPQSLTTITHAIIPFAGFGTRMLPLSKYLFSIKIFTLNLRCLNHLQCQCLKTDFKW